MFLHLQAVKKVGVIKTDQDGVALTLCQNSKLESRQIEMILHLHPVKRVS